MLQTFGALLIIFSGTMIGFYKSRQLLNRPRQLRALIQSLQRFETEVVYGHTPLAEAFEKIGKQGNPPVSDLFLIMSKQLKNEPNQSSAQMWRNIIETRWKFTSMGTAEKEICMNFGQSLGISDRNDQVKHIHLAIQQLQAEEVVAMDEHQRYGKMWNTIGLLAALLVVILMY